MLNFFLKENCDLDRSVIILTGGASSGFSEDKGILQLEGKPLLNYVVDAARGLADEVIVVTSSHERASLYSRMASSKIRFAVDVTEQKGSVVGALTGFEAANGDYALLLPYNSPFVSRKVLSLLLDLCIGKSAAIPRWTNRRIEPLHAAYNVKQALVAAKGALAENEFEMEAMVEKMCGVRYISTLVIEQLDPDLRTFFSVNASVDLKRAEAMNKSKLKRQK